MTWIAGIAEAPAGAAITGRTTEGAAGTGGATEEAPGKEETPNCAEPGSALAGKPKASFIWEKKAGNWKGKKIDNTQEKYVIEKIKTCSF